MYAVIISGGKQYRVTEGEKLKLEKLSAEIGTSINFEQVLLVGEGTEVKIGKPYLDKSSVSASIISHGRHKKIKIIKFRRRKHHMKKQGHRQGYTEVEITSIKAA